MKRKFCESSAEDAGVTALLSSRRRLETYRLQTMESTGAYAPFVSAIEDVGWPTATAILSVLPYSCALLP